MKLNNIKKLSCIAILALSMTGCSDWMEVESVNNTDLNGTIKTDEYYAALREWKKTPGLPQVWVWFDNWTGVSPTGENSLRGLPDSVTIASNWGGEPKFDLSPERRADMEYVQQVKGTKVVVTLFCHYVGEYMEHKDIYDIGNSSDPEVVRPAVRAYAEAIYDKVVENGYDGFDWDYEPWYIGGSEAFLWKNKVQRTIFIEELSYWFGKSSQTLDRGDRKPAKPGLLLIVDGEIGIGTTMDDEWPSYNIDYFVLQAYSGNNLEGRVADAVEDVRVHINAGKMTEREAVRRIILTENFESYASSGGGFLNMSNFIYNRNGIEQQIGGCGIYRVGFDYNQGKGDYDGSPEYYFLRQGIHNLYKNYRERQAEGKDPLE